MSKLKTKEDKINHVIKTLANAGLNAKLVPDGKVGVEAAKAAGKFFHGECSRLNTNKIICALEKAGFNDQLKADGKVGPQAIKAMGKFLSLAGD